MSYKDIILKNEEYAPARWWPHYAYHYTDISNAVSILESGMLYSRLRAEELHVMMNDNASRQVIDMTGIRMPMYQFPYSSSFIWTSSCQIGIHVFRKDQRLA